ncbi:MAG: DNA mismatch repair endonuclease MutH [Myxococcota bacterium]|nr:DNA mismatch repair endonuclease MutH [Myxococcota bacterium]
MIDRSQGPPPPTSLDELSLRAARLGGRSLSWLAGELGLTVPPDLRRHKGWVGQLMEIALGADGASLDGPDFAALGVELKTLPVSSTGDPSESTWVCTAAMDGSIAAKWSESRVARKLDCVLWVPVVGGREMDLGERRIGSPILWRADPEELQTLRGDWSELSEMIRMGDLERLDARLGTALQIRPKAASSLETVWALDRDGSWVETNPRGFYLRRSFTRAILQRHLGRETGS